ncbi:invasion associated locus B family protein [Paracoccaceae bacterium]|nr:invasion associated locus B family protein [Paracoccaceae bacterium]
MNAQQSEQNAADSLSLGLNIEVPDIGQPYIAERIGDWSMRCIRSENGQDPCELFQLLVNNEGNPLSEIMVFPLPQGQAAIAGATIIVPLKTLLTARMTIGFDAEITKSYPYSFCTEIGCIARIGLTEDDIALMKAGDQSVITIRHMDAPNKALNLNLSLSGFTAGFNKILNQ